MKKLTLLASILGLTVAAHAAAPALPLGITAVGYDDNLRHVTARLGLSENNALDLGVGTTFDNAAGNDKFQLGVSAYYLLKLQDWGVVDNHLALGGNTTIYSDSDLDLKLFAGLQPEVTLLDRLIVSIRFGAELAVSPDVAVGTVGQPLSIVNGFNFKLIW
jgi:hypothetical protein